MKHIKLYEDFVNESMKSKTTKATYWEEVAIPNVGNSNNVKADFDATKAAQALVDFWEKGKSFDKSGFFIKPERLKMLEDISKAKGKEIVTIVVIDGKANKDYQFKMEMRDTLDGVPNKNIYTWVSRVG
jgi:hypothetical protein